MVEFQISNLAMRVRFPSPAPKIFYSGIEAITGHEGQTTSVANWTVDFIFGRFRND